MRIELFGHLRSRSGSRYIELKIEGKISLKDALKMLPEGLRDMVIDEHGSIRPGIMILVNDVDVRSLYGYDVTVSDSDRISLVPSIHGGDN